MNAMTWWDHQTGSVWSQVWGQAIAGDLKGTTLKLIPAGIVPWKTWKNEHPQTLAMLNDKKGLFSRKEKPRDGWVIGVTIGEHAKAFYFPALVRDGLVNDFVGPFPVVLYADEETRQIHAYFRQIGDQVVTFELDETGQNLIDNETGTSWTLAQGLARDGALKNKTLQQVPYLSSFDWAWLDFHPDSEFYR